MNGGMNSERVDVGGYLKKVGIILVDVDERGGSEFFEHLCNTGYLDSVFVKRRRWFSTYLPTHLITFHKCQLPT